jgi:gamma-glutamyl:cysteine ligase YbdK (ATP-grasp superfamily)
MNQTGRLHVFQAYGVELEYMIVDRDSLDIRPLADELLKAELGAYKSDFENGLVTWSNELVMHVIELKSTRPESDFDLLQEAFVSNVSRINGVLRQWNAMLLPTGAHPWMNPLTETRLWPHDNNETYEAYNRIFDCRGHGWSNLQSTHLNLPFYDDEEFAKLHAAIRVVLPLLPALCASSPILDGKPTGLLNTRLQYYKTNQEAIPSITGKIIPEAVFSRRQYYNTVYQLIQQDIVPHDPDGILDPVWVNSRGAIPRFDRGSIEIRIMDVQECPAADLAIQSLVIETIRALANEKFAPLMELMRMKTEMLANILEHTVRAGAEATLESTEFTALFGVQAPASAGKVWNVIYRKLRELHPGSLKNWEEQIDTLLQQGPLARRMLYRLKGDHSPENLMVLYRQLAECLASNRMLSS